jgi:hypothetical protein
VLTHESRQATPWLICNVRQKVSPISYVRFLTYLAILGIGFQLVPRRHFISIRLAQKDDYRGILPAPGVSFIVGDDYRARGRLEPLFILSWWYGIDESRVRSWLGSPLRDFTLRQPVTDAGVYEGVQRQLALKHPGYKGDVRTMFWQKGERCYQAFFAQILDRWIVVDAVSWDQNVVP